MSYLTHSKSHPLDAAAFRSFIFQGKALFTLENKEKGTHITFRVKSPKRRRGEEEDLTLFDIEAKALNDGYSGMRYIGRLNRKARTLKESGRIEKDHPGLLTLKWLMRNWNNLEQFEEDGKLGMYHLGICCKCGMTLTVPESIENGIGPHCKRYREDRSIKIMEALGLIIKGMKYNDAVIYACEQFPDLIEKLFIPDEVRRKSDWIRVCQEVSDFGFF
jgi:hypothetical protein